MECTKTIPSSTPSTFRVPSVVSSTNTANFITEISESGSDYESEK